MSIVGWLIIIVGLLIGGALYFNNQTTDIQKDQFKARLTAQWRLAQVKAKEQLTNSYLADSLAQAGLPFTAATFNYIRILVLVAFLALGIHFTFTAHNPLALLLPVLVAVLLVTKKGFPLYSVLESMKKMNQLRLNKDLYVLYELIQQHAQSFKEKPRTVPAILEHVYPYVPRLQWVLDRCLSEWVKSPSSATDRFAADIGTQHARDIADILLNMSETNISSTLDVMQNKHTDFQAERIANFKRTQHIRNIIALILVTPGILMTVLDAFHLFANYTGSLMQLQ